jgi:hypothetical protein
MKNETGEAIAGESSGIHIGYHITDEEIDEEIEDFE